jgi:hypothetical protein
MYQPGIPTGTVNLNIDYKNIQDNFQQLDTTFAVDHVTYSNQTAQNGYHTAVHLNPISTTATNPPNNQPIVPPSVTAGIGQLFSSQINDGVNVDTALYFLTGGNRLLQLTRNFLPVSAASPGYTFLPGGIIVAWGIVTTSLSAGSTGTVTFPTISSNPVFTNVFNVFTSLNFTASNPPTSSSAIVLSIRKSTLSKTSFTWLANGSGSSWIGFYWVAIGN